MEEFDVFDQFSRYRGTGKLHRDHLTMIPTNLMCFYYFSDALGLSFGSSRNEEVYRLDQIKEFDPPESKWLVAPNILGIISPKFLSESNQKSF